MRSEVALAEGKPHLKQRVKSKLRRNPFCQPGAASMDYKPISSYGIVGDLHSAALVGDDGSVDWLCLPRFDSPSVFGAILDRQRGGAFRIAPMSEPAGCRQIYQPDTNVLVTRFLTQEGVAEVVDFMPLRSRTHPWRDSRLVRRARAVSGPASLRLRCLPAFDYGRQPHRVEIESGGARFRTDTLSLELAAPVPLESWGEQGVEATFTLREGQTLSFVVGLDADGSFSQAHFNTPESSLDKLEARTCAYWRRWLSKCTYSGRWWEMVHRSALVLELLAYAPTGAVIAAPTTSLPEWIGGERNWDYRFNWIRDAAFTVYALLRIGLTDEADRFMSWIENRCAELAEEGPLQTVYAVDGGRDLQEQNLEYLDGYRGSRPVRIGTDAFRQLQLDIYGPLIDAVYLYNKYARPITSVLWRDVRRLINWLCDSWSQADRGIWELRGEAHQLVHSKLMCWVALDRGLRLATQRSLPAELDRWIRCRDRIYEEVMTKGWSERRQAFTQSYGSDTLDAAVLMMPLVFFLAPADPRLKSTVDAICRPVSEGGLMTDGMLYRYRSPSSFPEDGLSGDEGTFNICTMWLVDALTRMGRIRDAHWLFEKVLSRANHVGLYSEQTSPGNVSLGNFPQGLTHLGLISAAYNLNQALDAERSRGPRHCSGNVEP